VTSTPDISVQAKRVIDLACQKRLSIVTAESCTAGALATLLADVPGAGEALLGGLVTYAKECKISVLNVPPLLLETETAVSRAVAVAMARGALARCGGDVAIAITCVAGPMPDEDGNPVGLTYIASATREDKTRCQQFQFNDGNREENRKRTLQEALLLLEVSLGDV